MAIPKVLKKTKGGLSFSRHILESSLYGKRGTLQNLWSEGGGGRCSKFSVDFAQSEVMGLIAHMKNLILWLPSFFSFFYLFWKDRLK